MSDTVQAPPPASRQRPHLHQQHVRSPDRPGIRRIRADHQHAAREGRAAARAATGHEVIGKAFERAKVERKGPAEAKAGHNQPPEPTGEGRAARPEEASIRAATGSRRASGRGRPVCPPHRRVKGASPCWSEGVPPPRHRHTLTGEPLKPDEETTLRRVGRQAPESVRRDVHRMHQEYSKAFQQYRGDHEVMKTLRPYHDLARSQGTTLPAALDNSYRDRAQAAAGPDCGSRCYRQQLELTHAGRPPYYVTGYCLPHPQSVARPAQVDRGAKSANCASAAVAAGSSSTSRHLRGSKRRCIISSALFIPVARSTGLPRPIHGLTSWRPDRAGAAARVSTRQPHIRERIYYGPPSAGTPAAQTRTPAPQTRTSDRSISGAPDGGSANGAVRKKSTRPTRVCCQRHCGARTAPCILLTSGSSPNSLVSGESRTMPNINSSV